MSNGLASQSHMHTSTMRSAAVGQSFGAHVQPLFNPAAEYSLSALNAGRPFGLVGSPPKELTAATLVGAGTTGLGTHADAAGLRRTDRLEQHFNPAAVLPAPRTGGPLGPMPAPYQKHFDDGSLAPLPPYIGPKTHMPLLSPLGTLQEETNKSPLCVTPAQKFERPSALKGVHFPVGDGSLTPFQINGDPLYNPDATIVKSENPFSTVSSFSQRGLARTPSKSSQKQLGGYPTVLKPNLKYTPSLAALLSNVVDPSPAPSPAGSVASNSSTATLNGLLRSESATCVSTAIPPALSLSILTSEHLGPEVHILSLIDPWPTALFPKAIAITNRKGQSAGPHHHSSTPSNVDPVKLDRIVNFLLAHSDDTFDCRKYLHNYLSIAPELCFVAFQDDAIIGA